MATDTSEKELEATIEAYLIDEKGERAENSRWLKGESKDFNPEFCVDETMLKAFLQHTQMDKVTRARIYDSPANTRKFLERLRNQITLRGVVDVLRHGMEHNATTFDLYYPIPTAGNVQAAIAYGQNRWTVVRQLRYLQTRPDIVLMLNGLPIITLELKNQLSCQNVDCAVRQYKTDRNPKDLLYMPKRCAAHFAVDYAEVKMCTRRPQRCNPCFWYQLWWVREYQGSWWSLPPIQ